MPSPLKESRLAALLDAPTPCGASHASAASFSDAHWQQRASPTPQCTFFLAFDAEQTIGLAAQVVAGDGGKRWRAIRLSGCRRWRG